MVKPVLGIISVKRTAAEKAFALGAWILDHDQSRLGAEEHLSEVVFFYKEMVSLIRFHCAAEKRFISKCG